jgi:hypothetical protein
MKKLIWVGVAALLHLTLLPLNAQPQAPIEPAQKQVAPNVEAFDKQMLETQALIKKMNEQMEAISQSKNPQERNQLLQEHWLTMQSTMTVMHGMWGPGMMPCCRNGARYQRNNGMMGGPGMMGWAKAPSISTHAASSTATRPQAEFGDTPRIPDAGWTRMSQSQREHRADVSSKSPAAVRSGRRRVAKPRLQVIP